MNQYQPKPKNILLADDDSDDCLLFEEALREICTESGLNVANDGIDLMDFLKKGFMPDVIFLDLNMPRKNGFECLSEIRADKRYDHIPVIIFSTTAQPEAVNKVYENGANYFVCKPNTFQMLKDAIQHILSINWEEKYIDIAREKRVFQP